MGSTLKKMFDYQRFEGNRDLQQVIDSVHAKYGVRELEMSDMETVYAAGVPEIPTKRSPKKQEN